MQASTKTSKRNNGEWMKDALMVISVFLYILLIAIIFTPLVPIGY